MTSLIIPNLPILSSKKLAIYSKFGSKEVGRMSESALSPQLSSLTKEELLVIIEGISVKFGPSVTEVRTPETVVDTPEHALVTLTSARANHRNGLK